MDQRVVHTLRMSISFDKAITSVDIPGPFGRIEAIVERPSSPQKKIGIVCHPHPLHEGSMNNKVVTTIVRTFQRLGVWGIRFNFRGVGGSEGEYGHVEGELQDLHAVIRWAREHFPDYELWLAGFSFGSFIAYQAAMSEKVAVLVLIAPPVHHFDFKNLPTEVSIPWVVVQGDQDEVVPAEEVYQWISSLKNPPKLIRLPNTGHFFHGELITLRDLLIKELQYTS